LENAEIKNAERFDLFQESEGVIHKERLDSDSGQNLLFALLLFSDTVVDLRTRTHQHLF